MNICLHSLSILHLCAADENYRQCAERWLGLTLRQFASHLNNAAPALKEGGGLCPHCAIVHYCIQYLSALETALCEIYCSALEIAMFNRACVTCKGGLGLPSQVPQLSRMSGSKWVGEPDQGLPCSLQHAVSAPDEIIPDFAVFSVALIWRSCETIDLQWNPESPWSALESFWNPGAWEPLTLVRGALLLALPTNIEIELGNFHWPLQSHSITRNPMTAILFETIISRQIKSVTVPLSFRSITWNPMKQRGGSLVSQAREFNPIMVAVFRSSVCTQAIAICWDWKLLLHIFNRRSGLCL